MNQELGVDGEEASDGSEDSETGYVLHQYEDVYKVIENIRFVKPKTAKNVTKCCFDDHHMTMC